MSLHPLVSIVIVNYNGCELLKDCLTSLRSTNYSPYEIIVVDNGSTDLSCSMIKESFQYVKLIAVSKNLGYAKGNNVGILNSKGEFIVLLNNDTVVTPSWLPELLNQAQLNPDCFYQPKILLMKNRLINSLGNRIQLFGFAYPSELNKPDRINSLPPKIISYASGACVLASKRLIRKVGLLDESDLFTFYEDVNWGWRGLLLGVKSVCIPTAVVYHKWGGSWGNKMSQRKFFLLERARLASLLRNYSTSTLVCLFPSCLLIELSTLLYSLKSGCFTKKILAYSDIIKSRDSLLSEKRQLARTESDKLVIKSFSNDVIHPYFGILGNCVNKGLTLLSKNIRSSIK